MTSIECDRMIESVLQGDKLRKSEANKLEQELQEQPEDIITRAKLLGYYFTRYNTSPSKAKKRQKHVLWMVNAIPSHPFMSLPFALILKSENGGRYYEDYKKAWLDLIDMPGVSAAVLANAANALSYDDMPLAAEVIARARVLDPTNPYVLKIAERIGMRRHGS